MVDLMKKTAIILYPQFSEYELSVVQSVLMQGNKQIITVGVSEEPVRGEAGLVCLVDQTIANLRLEEIDSLILPGCLDISVVLEEEQLLQLIKQAFSRDYIIGSISSSPHLLASAGVLQGRNYTIGLPLEYIESSDVFDERRFITTGIVEDGTLLTAKGSSFIAFGVRFGCMLGLTFNEKWYGDYHFPKVNKA